MLKTLFLLMLLLLLSGCEGGSQLSNDWVADIPNPLETDHATITTDVSSPINTSENPPSSNDYTHAMQGTDPNGSNDVHASLGEAPEPTQPTQPTIVLPSNAHYYARELAKLIDEATGRINAVLYDLDGCGSDEMVFFDEGVFSGDYWADPPEGALIKIFDDKCNESNPYSIVPSHNLASYELFITQNAYLVSAYADHAYFWIIYSYKAGTLSKVAELADYTRVDVGPFYVNGVEYSESDFFLMLNEYGVYNIRSADIALVVGYGESWEHAMETQTLPTLTNDISIILQMTDDYSK